MGELVLQVNGERRAVHAAVGLRLRDIPFTPARVRAAATQL